MTREIFVYNLGSPTLLGGSNNTVINMTVNEGTNFTINCEISDSCPLPTTVILTFDNGLPVDLTDISSISILQAASSASYTCRADNGQTVSIVYMVRVVMSTPTSSQCKQYL